jgi:hypothetical protein
MTDLPSDGPDLRKFVALTAAVWPGATVYPPGARFRVRDLDELGDRIPDFVRGRSGTIVTVDGPVVVGGGDIHRRKVSVKGVDAVGFNDVLDLLGVVVEMVHVVQYDDEPGIRALLSHRWMEPLTELPVAARPAQRLWRFAREPAS